MTVQETLSQRKGTHGEFKENASYAQGIKSIYKRSPAWHQMSNEQREALEMIASKISRILSGGFEHKDSWHDIAGYASLGEKSE